MFKDNYTKDLGNTINKSDPNYGKPQQGTLTEFRGQKAHTHVHKVQLNEYETDLDFLQFFQSNTTVCFVRVVNLKLFLF